MFRSIRSVNLDLARWLNHGHESTAKKLAAITNANYLSKMATGDMEITDRKARQIEKALNLPSGWLDRDNVALLSLGMVDFELLSRLGECSEEAKKGLLTFVSSKV